MEPLENEELFAGEAALIAQQTLFRNTGDTTDSLQVHNEPLLADDSDHEWTRDVQQEREIWWLLPFGLMYTLALGGVAVPKVNLMMSLVCRDYFAEQAKLNPGFINPPLIPGRNNPQCHIPEIQARVSRFQLAVNLIAGILSALISPQLGHLSDRYGRTRLLVVCGFGAACTEFICALLATWPATMSVYWFLLGAAIDGLCSSFTGTQALVNSYASDCTPPERRSAAFGLFHGSLFLGIALGPMSAAFLIAHLGSSKVVFYIGFALFASFTLALLLVVPESLSKERQLAARARHHARPKDPEASHWFSPKNLNPLKLFAPLRVLVPAVGRPSELFPGIVGANAGVRRNIIVLASMDTALFGVTMGVSQVIVLYSERMFGWGDVETSLYVAIVNSVRVVNLFGVLPLLSKLFRTPVKDDGHIHGCDMLDVVVMRVSVCFEIIGFTGYSLSKTGRAWIISGAINCLGGLGSPTVQSSITKHVPKESVGRMLGALGLLHALSRVVAPAILNLLYSFTTVFIALGSVFGVVLILSLFVRPYGMPNPYQTAWTLSNANLSTVSLEDDGDEPDMPAEANEDGEDEEDQLLR
ncbi:hypothetical protein N7468_007996 [Penicillium chermesinum]|uniref:Major facilitator superfamily (MFS) profile domain-containing protein n=1 Tax=Penicillium chermesinum TaxID=63820 RepID=A0A9W9NNY5_9EURO|nr:uncharacterized protein N7468_007996 [Penicillium chermesinum]KAJ5223454.1 hypothetical protein N7468_007996 [Penicillium chermesinum]KAJ6155712.1 hypothetical protein N7470_006278 [Penicillium chermesinum]